MISVPLRGFWYADNDSMRYMRELVHVSVPLRGFWYADQHRNNRNDDGDDEFQSPYGDFGTLTLRVQLRIFY